MLAIKQDLHFIVLLSNKAVLTVAYLHTIALRRQRAISIIINWSLKSDQLMNVSPILSIFVFVFGLHHLLRDILYLALQLRKQHEKKHIKTKIWLF